MHKQYRKNLHRNRVSTKPALPTRELLLLQPKLSTMDLSYDNAICMKYGMWTRIVIQYTNIMIVKNEWKKNKKINWNKNKEFVRYFFQLGSYFNVYTQTERQIHKIKATRRTHAHLLMCVRKWHRLITGKQKRKTTTTWSLFWVLRKLAWKCVHTRRQEAKKKNQNQRIFHTTEQLTRP